MALAPKGVRLHESRFASSDRAMILAPDVMRLFYYNADATKFNTEIALEEVNNVNHAQALDFYLGYWSSRECLCAHDNVARMTHAERANHSQVIVLSCGNPTCSR